MRRAKPVIVITALLLAALPVWLLFVEAPTAPIDPTGVSEDSVVAWDQVQGPGHDGASQHRQDASREKEDDRGAFGSLRVSVKWQESNAPAVGVSARVIIWGVANPVQGRVRYTTDADGIFTIHDAPVGRVGLFFDRGVSAGAEVFPETQSKVEVLLPEGMTVQVRVLDQSLSTIGDAEVLLSEPDNVTRATIVGRSANDGICVVRGVSFGQWVSARARGYAQSLQQAIHWEPGTTQAVELVLSADGGGLFGTVVDASNSSVPGALVLVQPSQTTLQTGPTGEIVGPPPPSSQTTSGDGTFDIAGLRPGRFRLRVFASAFAPYEKAVQVSPGSSTEVIAALKAGGRVFGAAYGSNGTPLAQVTVAVGEFGDAAYRSTATNAEGSYSLRGLPSGRVMVTARHEEHGSARKEMQLRPGSEHRCDLFLSSGGSFCGVLRDADRRPLGRWSVNLIAQHDPSTWLQSTRTEEDGAFELTNCPQGSFSVQFGLEAFWMAGPIYQIDGVMAHGGRQTISIPQEKMPNSSIRGILIDAVTGEMVQNARIQPTRRPGVGLQPVIANRDGEFVIEPLSAGTYDLLVETPTRLARVVDIVVEPNEEKALAAVEVRDVGYAQIVVEPKTEREVEGLKGEIVAVDGGWSPRLTATGANLFVEKVPVGRYRLRVWSMHCALREEEIDIRPGSNRLVVGLRPGVWRRIVCRGGAPGCQELLFVVRDAAGRTIAEERLQRDASGAFVCDVAGLEEGTYWIRADYCGRVSEQALEIVSLDELAKNVDVSLE